MTNGTYVRHGDQGEPGRLRRRRHREQGSPDPCRPAGPARRRTASGRWCCPTRSRCSERSTSADPAKPDEYLIAASLVGSTAAAAIDRAVRMDQLGLAANQRLCVVQVRNHSAGVRSFCRNDFHLYFGDLDIIQAYRAIADAGGTGLRSRPCRAAAELRALRAAGSVQVGRVPRPAHRRGLRDLLGRHRGEPLRRLLPRPWQVGRAGAALPHQQHSRAALTGATA